MILTNTKPSVWIGCLACYNNGYLTGQWFPADEAEHVTPADLHDSPTSHEELWCFDLEGFPKETGEISPHTASLWGELYNEVGEEQWPALLGSTPSGWDCSGFVMWILAQTGRSVGHGADIIASTYSIISPSEAQPGDLVWWPGQHIAVYAGNGQIIGAQNPGQGTVQTSLYGSYQFVRVS